MMIYWGQARHFLQADAFPLSNRHGHLASQLVHTSSQVRQRGLDHQIRLAVSLAALVGTLLLGLLSTPAPELP
jgi:hypothetical protein